MNTQILNWKEVVDHFGIDKAKVLSKELQKEFDKSKGKENLEPMYDDEGFALFGFAFIKENVSYYLFTGTAK